MDTTTKNQFVFVCLEGTPYQIGEQQAEFIQTIPTLRSFFTSTPPTWSNTYYKEVESLYQQTCPGLIEEVQGIADILKVSPAQIIYHPITYLIPPHCSHFVLLPQITADHHLLVGRNYDFGPEKEDNRLCLTRPVGKFSHIGFSSILLGRSDGMNDQGLVVTMSAGGIPVGSLPGMTPPLQKGLQFWAVIRSILENCRNVEEGLAWLKQTPCCGNPILILADCSGKAAKVEIYGKHLAIDTINEESPSHFLCATNHFTNPDMTSFNSSVMRNSLVRRQVIEDSINQSSPLIGKKDMHQVLSKQYPKGLCNHFYKEYFGTLYSLIADPMEGTFDVCFGSPQVNPWMTFTLNEPSTFQIFSADLPQSDGFNEFWG